MKKIDKNLCKYLLSCPMKWKQALLESNLSGIIGTGNRLGLSVNLTESPTGYICFLGNSS